MGYKIMAILLEIGKTILLLGIGAFIGSYVTYRLQIKQENISANRVRLLSNIDAIEDLINMIIGLGDLKKDLSRVENLMHSLDENISLLENEATWVKDELAFISNEQARDPTDIRIVEELNSRLNIMELRHSELKTKLTEQESKSSELGQELHEMNLRLKDDSERLKQNDLGVTVLAIDPSGQLANYLVELENILYDPNKEFSSDSRAFELRLKIRNHIHTLIDKFK
jgi:hypothetical protein